jgi:hypothetical protein
MARGFTITPLTGSIGARVTGVDLAVQAGLHSPIRVTSAIRS